MIDPGTANLAAGGISALASLGGGALSSNFLSSSGKKDRRFQRNVMQNAIQWRVEDAKKAGIHPLFALGAQVATGASGGTFVGDPLGPSLAEAGQNISNAVVRSSARLSPEETQRHQLDMALGVKAMQKTDAEIDLIRQQSNALNAPGGPPGLQNENNPELYGPGNGFFQVKPAEVTSSKLNYPTIEAGLKPGESEEHMPWGPMVVPKLQGESYYEMKESMSPIDYLAMVKRNIDLYGWDWLVNFARYHTAQTPKNHIAPLNDRFGRNPYQFSWQEKLSQGARNAIQREIGKYKDVGRRYERRAWMRKQGQLPERR